MGVGTGDDAAVWARPGDRALVATVNIVTTPSSASALTPGVVVPGLRANRWQFFFLVAQVGFVGSMLGIERTVVPLLGRERFDLTSHTAVLSFIVAFGLAKAPLNLAAGQLADRIGRRPVLLLGWAAGLAVPALIAAAPTWEWIIVANVLLGLQQGLCWSTSIFMKVDLAGDGHRGLVIGINECVGYAGIAIAAYSTGVLAAAHGPQVAPFVLGEAFALAGLVVALTHVAETTPVLAAQRQEQNHASIPLNTRRSFVAICLAGFVTKMVDAAVWGLLPVWFRSQGASLSAVAVLAAVYPAAWAVLQPAAGAVSDATGRRMPILAGLATQSIALIALAASRSFFAWVGSTALLGVGTALVYPTLLATAADLAPPGQRASSIGHYRLWRDTGFVAGALLAGRVADRFGVPASVRLLAILMVTAFAILAAVDLNDNTSSSRTRC